MDNEGKESKPTTEVVNETNIGIPDKDRLAIFKLYCEGKKLSAIAEQYGVKVGAIYWLSQHEKWKEKRKKMIKRGVERYGDHVTEAMLKCIRILNMEISSLLQRADSGIRLQEEDRKFIADTFAKLSKERRLEDGTPTENLNTSGTIEHRIILPPGAKRFGVFPPGPNTTLLEEKPQVIKVESDSEDEEDDL